MKITSFSIRVLAVLLVGFLVQGCVSGNQTQDQLQDLSDGLYKQLNDKWGIPKGGVFLRVSSPKGSHLVSSNIGPNVKETSYFRVASITKTFTAAAIMKLHQDGKLSIDDTITRYLPSSAAYDIPYKDRITIKQLLQHRAGVFDVTNQDIPATVRQPYAGMRYADYIRGQDDKHTFTFDELVGVVAENGLSNFAPGTTFQYSNTGYNILAKIIETVSGMSYSDYITETFIWPLRLSRTYSVWSGTDVRMKEPFVDSFLYLPGQKAIDTSEDNMSVNVSEGNIVSSPADISRWMELLLTGQAGVSAANVARMKEMLPADVSHGVYGLGLTYNDGLGFGHNGAHLSYLSTLRYNPDTKTTVLIVATFFRVTSSPDQTNADFLALADSLVSTAQQAVLIANR